MTRLSRFLGACIVIVTVIGSGRAVAGVDWAGSSYDEVTTRAKTENKHVFIDFYATWCAPCKMLEEVTYKDDRVVAFLNEMIPVKWDAEKGEGLKVAGEYRVSAYPTLILLGPDGKEIDRHLGFLEPDAFLQVMTDYKNGIGTVAYYQKVVEKDPKDAGAWKTLGMKYADAARAEEARRALKTYLELAPGAPAEEKAEVMYTLGEVSYRGKSYDEAIEIFGKVAKEFPDTEWQDQALVTGARAYQKMGNAEKSIEWYLSYVNRHPDDPKALNAFAWFCASTGIGMDKALPYAEKAVELSNRAPGILDTLAELYFSMGEYDKAIEAGEEALKKDPDDTYLAEQLEKFKKATEKDKAPAVR